MARNKSRTGEANSSLSDTSDADTGRSNEWKTLPYLTVFVDNIPSHWMVAELKGFLDGFGTIVKVEIFENHEVLLLVSILI